MKTVRRLIFFSFCFFFFPYQVFGDSLLVLSWNLNNFPSGVYNLRKPEAEGLRIGAVAAKIRKQKPDIILLQEVRDSAVCLRLIDSTGDPSLKLIKCSSFTDNSGIPIFQQLAIISRFASSSAIEKRWSTFGVVDPPRGFVAAVLSTHSGKVLVCNVHLKSNRSTGDPDRSRQLNILKRELASEQLIKFISAVQDTISKIIIGGDFNTNTDNPEFLSEATFSTIRNAGFICCFDGIGDVSRRVTWRSTGKYPDATFDSIFARGFKFIAYPMFIDSEISDHNGVLCTLKGAR